MNRRSLIVGAGFAVAAPALVRAETMLEIPGDPLTARGLFAASTWAAKGFGELPACRLAYADGEATNWMVYNCVSRKRAGNATYATSIDVVTTDAEGRRFITSVPVDGVKLANDHQTYKKRYQAQMNMRAERLFGFDDAPF